MAVIKLNRTKTGVVPTTLADGELYIDQLYGKLYWADATGVIKTTELLMFVSGTKMIFRQSSAPTGWTKETSNDDAALRVVSGAVGTGGATNFSASFGGSATTGSHTLTTSQMPAHNHAVYDPGHRHQQRGSTIQNFFAGIDNSSAMQADSRATGVYTEYSGTGISLYNTGGGQGHSHTMPNLKYVDVIVATKD